MSRVNGVQGGLIQYPGSGNVSSNVPQQRLPVFNPLQAKMRSLHQTALSETMESMSLVMGSRLRQLSGRRSGTKDTIRELREEVSDLLPSVDEEIAIALVEEFGDMLDGEQDVLEMLTEKDIPDGAKLPLLAALIRSGQLSARKRKRLEDAMETLLSDDELSIGLFAWLDLSEVDSKKLLTLKQLYQRISRDDEEADKSLAEWFTEVQEWPDRYKRVKVLIKALAMDLKMGLIDSKERVYSAIYQLKKLLMFLGISETSYSLATEVELDNDIVLAEIITVLEQTWLTHDWFVDRADSLGIEGEKTGLWLTKLSELLKLLPVFCYLDDDHNEQILTMISEAIDVTNV
ncbi:TyeA family type III secretion system gatekeeper subunit [Enterobacter hormaechei]